MPTTLTTIHWVYLLFVVCIIVVMCFKKDTTIISIAGIFLTCLVSTGSILAAVNGIFSSFIYAITALLPVILIISVIVSMSKSLIATGINDTMVKPFSKLITTPFLAFWIIGILMMIISWFFWPSPAIALLGAVLVPVAIKVGLPRIGIAMAINLFGHGIALSGDYIIQGAPKIAADGAGIPISSVIHASIPLVIVMGTVTTITAYYFLRRDIKRGNLTADVSEADNQKQITIAPFMTTRKRRILAILIPLIYLVDICLMLTKNIQGDAATSLIGGTSFIILILVTIFGYQKESLERTTNYLIEGLQFGFKIFGPVLPIAAFFYLGDAGFQTIVGNVLPKGSDGIMNDLGKSLASIVPLTPSIGAITSTGVGIITGLDGSGFSGLSLSGSIAVLFSHAVNGNVAVLTALGQVTTIWVGGGTLIPWALIPAAAICKVSPFELAKRNFVPVVIGLTVTTIVSLFFL